MKLKPMNWLRPWKRLLGTKHDRKLSEVDEEGVYMYGELYLSPETLSHITHITRVYGNTSEGLSLWRARCFKCHWSSEPVSYHEADRLGQAHENGETDVPS